MSDIRTETDECARRLEALTRDRDYWRAQHDAVLADWKADADEWARERAALKSADPAPAPGGRLRRVLETATRPRPPPAG